MPQGVVFSSVSSNEEMELPLSGIRVLDLTHMLPGPFSTMLMADMGAEVIKIEPPNGGDSFRKRPPFINRESSAFMMVNRSKKSVVLDLRSPEGLKHFKKLLRSSDVLLEQFRPGVMERLGLDYKTVKAINPGIIYCSLSGFGQDGPYRDMPGHDINYLSISGILDTIGMKGEKPGIPGIQIADMCSAQWAFISVLLGLMARGRNGGEGQHIDLSITDTVFPWLSLFLSDFVADGTITSRGEARSGGAYAFYNVYETADKRYVSLGAAEQKFWAAFCKAAGHEEWIEKQNDPELIDEVSALFRKRTQAEWNELLIPANCCYTPVKNIKEALDDPQLLERGMETSIFHPTEGQVINFSFPVQFSDMKPVEPRSPPAYGEHNEQLLADK